MQVSMKKIVLFGPPGAGKGVFSDQIKRILPDIVHISTGDIFREHVKNKTPLGAKVKDYLDEGTLVPDDIAIKEVQLILKKEEIKKGGFVLDGFPRTVKQAEALAKMTSVDMCLLLTVSPDTVEKRILGRFMCQKCNAIYNIYTLKPKKEGICDKCGAKIKFEQRSDDTKETFKKRMALYKQYSPPILDYYTKKKLVKKIDTEDTLKLSDDDLKKILEIT